MSGSEGGARQRRPERRAGQGVAAESRATGWPLQAIKHASRGMQSGQHTKHAKRGRTRDERARAVGPDEVVVALPLGVKLRLRADVKHIPQDCDVQGAAAAAIKGRELGF